MKVFVGIFMWNSNNSRLSFFRSSSDSPDFCTSTSSNHNINNNGWEAPSLCFCTKLYLTNNYLKDNIRESITVSCQNFLLIHLFLCFKFLSQPVWRVATAQADWTTPASLCKTFFSHQQTPSVKGHLGVNPCFLMSRLMSHLSYSRRDFKVKSPRPRSDPRSGLL